MISPRIFQMVEEAVYLSLCLSAFASTDAHGRETSRAKLRRRVRVDEQIQSVCVCVCLTMRRCSPSPRGASARAPCRTSPAPTERCTSWQRVEWVTMEEEDTLQGFCSALPWPALGRCRIGRGRRCGWGFIGWERSCTCVPQFFFLLSTTT